MMHPDIREDVLAARAAQRTAAHPQIIEDPGMKRVREQAARMLAMPELVAYLADRYLVTNAETPPTGVSLEQWMLARSLQAGVLEHLFQLGGQHNG